MIHDMIIFIEASAPYLLPSCSGIILTGLICHVDDLLL